VNERVPQNRKMLRKFRSNAKGKSSAERPRSGWWVGAVILSKQKFGGVKTDRRKKEKVEEKHKKEVVRKKVPTRHDYLHLNN